MMQDYSEIEWVNVGSSIYLATLGEITCIIIATAL